MVAMLGRPWAWRTTSSGSRPNFAAQAVHTRATAGVESTSTPSMSKSRARQRICIETMISSLDCGRARKIDVGEGVMDGLRDLGGRRIPTLQKPGRDTRADTARLTVPIKERFLRSAGRLLRGAKEKKKRRPAPVGMTRLGGGLE